MIFEREHTRVAGIREEGEKVAGESSFSILIYTLHIHSCFSKFDWGFALLWSIVNLLTMLFMCFFSFNVSYGFDFS